MGWSWYGNSCSLDGCCLGHTRVASGTHTDARLACRPNDDEKASQEAVVSADSAVGKDGDGMEGAERQATVDDLEWDDVIHLWANAHACYIETVSYTHLTLPTILLV